MAIISTTPLPVVVLCYYVLYGVHSFHVRIHKQMKWREPTKYPLLAKHLNACRLPQRQKTGHPHWTRYWSNLPPRLQIRSPISSTAGLWSARCTTLYMVWGCTGTTTRTAISQLRKVLYLGNGTGYPCSFVNNINLYSCMFNGWITLPRSKRLQCM